MLNGRNLDGNDSDFQPMSEQSAHSAGPEDAEDATEGITRLHHRTYADLHSWFWLFRGEGAGHRITLRAHCLILRDEQTPPTVSTSISLTDETTEWCRESAAEFPLAAIQVPVVELELETPIFSVSRDAQHLLLSAVVPDGAIELAVTRIQTSSSDAAGCMVNVEADEGYCSLRSLATSGLVVMDGWTARVSGITDVDTQWFSCQPIRDEAQQ